MTAVTAVQTRNDDRQDYTRSLHGALIRAAAGENERRFELSFSSELAYDRWYGPEILDHSGDALELDRLRDVGCVLFNHNRDKVVGKIINAWVGGDARGYATIELDSDEESERVYQKIKGGSLKGVSVGYGVSVWEEVAANKKSTCGRFTGPCYIARRWEPYEISIVSIPADPSVGVGRDNEKDGFPPKPIIKKERSLMDEEMNNTDSITGTGQQEPLPPVAARQSEAAPPAVRPTEQSPAAASEADMRQAAADERSRIMEITTLCREFDTDPESFVRDGAAVELVRAAILENLKQTKAPVAARTVDEGDKLKAAAVHGLMLRAGVIIEKPSEGAEQFRGMSLHNVAAECLRTNGVNNAFRLDHDVMLREYLTPSSLFTSVLDTVIKETFEKAYGEVITSFEKWTRRGTLTNFKPARTYTVGVSGELLLVPEGGELKHDHMLFEKGPIRTLLTYGRQFSMTREAFINDDIDFIQTIPAAYAASAKMSINRLVYATLAKNPVIWDGKQFFTEAHNNISEVSGVPNVQTLADMRRKLRNQKGTGENLKLNTPGRFLIVPTALEVEAGQFLMTSFDSNKPIAGIVNPFHNAYTIISDAELDDVTDTSGKEWYLTADKAMAPIEVDYLKGRDTPTIAQKQPPAGQLGYIWDVYMDWGVTVVDYKRIVKNSGE